MVDAKTLGVLTSLGVGVAVFVVCMALFEVLRRALPRIYYYRQRAARYPEFNDYAGAPLGSAPPPGCLWPATVLPYKHSSVLRSHGLDSALFLRFVQTQALTFILIAIVGIVVLFPVFATAGNKDLPDGSRERTTGVDVLSLANVPPRDPRLWAVLIVDAAVLVIILFMQTRDIKYYTAVRSRHRLARAPDNYSILILDLPPELRDEAALYAFFDASLFPGQVEAVHPVRHAASLLKLRNKYTAAYTAREAALLASEAEDEAAKRAGTAPPARTKKLDGEVVPESAFFAAREEAAFDDAANARADLDAAAPQTAAAFVTFRTRHAAAAAASVPMMLGVTVLRAPDPSAVFWDRLKVNRRTAFLRKMLTLGGVLLLILFWFIPVAAVSALSNLGELSKQDGFGFLADFEESVPGLAKVVEGFLPPILLLVLNVLVPVFIRLIIVHQRWASRSRLDAEVTRWHYIFLVATTFLGNVVAGSLLSAIDTLVNNPSFTQVIDILSKTIPGQAGFFLNYVALQVFVTAIVGILMLGKLFLQPFVLMGAKSERMRRKAEDAFSAYPFFKAYAIVGLHTLIATVYSTIAPLCAVFVGLGLFVVYVCLKHVVMYSNKSLYEGGGENYERSWEHSFFNLGLHQLILIGLFSLKKAPVQAGLEVLLLLVTIVYYRKVRRKYYGIAATGALADFQVSSKDAEIVPPHFAELYVHPGLQPIGDIPALEMQ